MVIVKVSQVSLVEGKPAMCSEASSLGLQPGEWPMLIGIVDESNEGFLFIRA